MIDLKPKKRIVLEEEIESKNQSEADKSNDNYLIKDYSLEKYKNQKLTLLHLSDLQFGWEKDNRGMGFANLKVYESLIRTFQDNMASLGDWKPELIVISGNLAYHGASEEYESCKINFIEPLLKVLGLKKSHVITCPGNSDIMLNNVGRFERPSPNTEDDDISDINWDTISSLRKEHFLDYLNCFGGGDFYNFCKVYSFQNWEWFKILSMNSAWDCRDSEESDRGRLRLGKSLVNEFIRGLKSGQNSKCALVLNHPIGTIYHNPNDYSQSRPYTWFHCSEWPTVEKENSVKKQIMDNIDYLLSGHLDYKENIVVDPLGKTIRLLDGKYYINKSVGYGYLCRLVTVGRYTNTQYINLTTTSSQYDNNWKIGPPTNVSGENDSPIKIFGDYYPLFVEVNDLAGKGKIEEATSLCLKYLFSEMVIHNNSLNLDDEALNNLYYHITNNLKALISSARDTTDPFVKIDLEGR